MNIPAELYDVMAQSAINAGVVIMEIYHDEAGIKSQTKSDLSPVTLADQRAEALILADLKAIAPDIPILAEEAVSAGDIPEPGDLFFLVDPVDGTKEFINKGKDFTVNIGLIQYGRPIAGVIYAPALEKLWVADGPASAWYADQVKPGDKLPKTRTPMRISAPPIEGLRAVASKSHRTQETDDFLTKFNVRDIVSAGSSLKFCLIASGKADIYPRMGRTMEWDTAAGHAIVQAAGGRVLTLDGQDLTYGKTHRDYDNPHFIVYGDVTPFPA